MTTIIKHTIKWLQSCSSITPLQKHNCKRSSTVQNVWVYTAGSGIHMSSDNREGEVIPFIAYFCHEFPCMSISNYGSKYEADDAMLKNAFTTLYIYKKMSTFWQYLLRYIFKTIYNLFFLQSIRNLCQVLRTCICIDVPSFL